MAMGAFYILDYFRHNHQIKPFCLFYETIIQLESLPNINTEKLIVT